MPQRGARLMAAAPAPMLVTASSPYYSLDATLLRDTFATQINLTWSRLAVETVASSSGVPPNSPRTLRNRPELQFGPRTALQEWSTSQALLADGPETRLSLVENSSRFSQAFYLHIVNGVPLSHDMLVALNAQAQEPPRVGPAVYLAGIFVYTNTILVRIHFYIGASEDYADRGTDVTAFQRLADVRLSPAERRSYFRVPLFQLPPTRSPRTAFLRYRRQAWAVETHVIAAWNAAPLSQRLYLVPPPPVLPGVIFENRSLGGERATSGEPDTDVQLEARISHLRAALDIVASDTARLAYQCFFVDQYCHVIVRSPASLELLLPFPLRHRVDAARTSLALQKPLLQPAIRSLPVDERPVYMRHHPDPDPVEPGHIDLLIAMSDSGDDVVTLHQDDFVPLSRDFLSYVYSFADYGPDTHPFPPEADLQASFPTPP